MKKLLLILLCLPMIGFGQNVYIPDANFKAYLVANSGINTNGDSEIQVSEAAAFNGTIYCPVSNISDLTGIEAFTALTNLSCGSNQLTSINLSNNTALTNLSCGYNQLTSLDVSNNTALTTLSFGDNSLTSLDVSNNTALTYLQGRNNQLTSFDVSQNIMLETLWCQDNQLSMMDISNNALLEELRCNDNQLISLNLTGANSLIELYCSDNQLTSLNISSNTLLASLSCNNNQLININTNGASSLSSLYCYDNQLTSLDVSQNTSLVWLGCWNNHLTQLNVQNGNNQNMAIYDTDYTWNGIHCSNNPNLSCILVDDSVWCSANWMNSFIDPQHYFSNNCSGTTDIQEHSTNKELLKVTDLLGRETNQTNQPLFYIYDDGTVEKRIVIE